MKEITPEEKRILELIERLLNTDGNKNRIALVVEYTSEIKEGVLNANR